MKKLISTLFSLALLLCINQVNATTLESEQSVLQYFYEHNEEPTIVMISHEKAPNYEKEKALFQETQKRYSHVHFVEVNAKNMVAFNHLDDFKATFILINHGQVIQENNIDSPEKLQNLLSDI